jgi:Tfp pilus assembly protein PilN
VSAPLNLARRPFRNERLPTLALSVGLAALSLLSVRHALLARDLMPGRARDVEGRVSALEREIGELRAESAALQRLAAPPEALREWGAVKRLVDRRTFSWTGLFGALEEALPPGVKLVSVTPRDDEGGRIELALVAVGRGDEDALALLQGLQSHPDFEDAFLERWNEGRDGVDIASTVRYAPRARGGRP